MSAIQHLHNVAPDSAANWLKLNLSPGRTKSPTCGAVERCEFLASHRKPLDPSMSTSLASAEIRAAVCRRLSTRAESRSMIAPDLIIPLREDRENIPRLLGPCLP